MVNDQLGTPKENQRLSKAASKPPHSKNFQLMIVAGEASGDAHGAALVKALRTEAQTEIEFFGATGAQMRAAGVESIVDTDKLAILGLWEIASALPKFWQAFRKLKTAASQRKPKAAILIDWPDFNLRLARWLHRHDVRVIYYVSPQLWAWRSHRARNVRRDVDLLLSILPFEKTWYAARGMTHVKYVGHPLSGDLDVQYDREEFCRRNDLDSSRPIVALLPGSRHKELVRILPPMLDAVEVISRQQPETQFVIVIAPNRDPKEVEEIISARPGGSSPKDLRVIHHETREALTAADAAAIASGTATLEAALIGTPMVIGYKESFLNWHLLGSLINVEHYGLVNLIAERRVATELMQNELNGERLANELLRLLESERNAAVRLELRQIREQLGPGGASQRAAQEILEFLEANSK